MVAVAVTSGTSDVPRSLLVAVAMATFNVLSTTIQAHTERVNQHSNKVWSTEQTVLTSINELLIKSFYYMTYSHIHYTLLDKGLWYL